MILIDLCVILFAILLCDINAPPPPEVLEG